MYHFHLRRHLFIQVEWYNIGNVISYWYARIDEATLIRIQASYSSLSSSVALIANYSFTLSNNVVFLSVFFFWKWESRNLLNLMFQTLNDYHVD